MAASVNNYTVGKGIAQFKKTGSGTFRDLGNAPEFEFTPEIEKLEHFSSRAGVKSKDLTVVLEKKGTLRIVLDEWDVENIALALLDDTYSGSGAIDIFSGNSVEGEVLFTGTNTVGPKYEWHFLSVSFIPNAGLNLISDEWGQIELNGDVAAVNDVFGTVTAVTVTA